MNCKHAKRYQWMICFISTAILLGSFVLEWMHGWVPCSLCWMQRFCLLMVALVSAVSLYRGVTASRIGLWCLQIGGVGAGLFFAGRQVWLQWMHANHLGACMPGLDILLQYFSWIEVVRALLLGNVSCIQDQVRVLGMSLAFWSVLVFMSLLVLSVLGYWMSRCDSTVSR